jgi:alkanesulfonate monooxygenase SsuD/methylene tetrahydromethanopterin reductase-like flavin-dependent oxidoreductase (luciferase family)
VGSFERVADEMAAWHEAGACDGFVLLPPDIPQGLADICDELIPILQERGVAQSAYSGTTFRERLGRRLA